MKRYRNIRRYMGLRFNYRINSNNQTPYMDKYMDLDEFIATSFPKKANPRSPRENTKIFNVYWDSEPINVPEDITVSGLKELIRSVKISDGEYDMASLLKKNLRG